MKGRAPAFAGQVRGFVRVIFAVLVLAVWLSPNIARACKCGPAKAAAVAAPHLVSTAGIVAGPEVVSLDCDRHECTWRSIHTFDNTGTTDLTTRVLQVTALASNVEVRAGNAVLELGPPRELSFDPEHPDPDLPEAYGPLGLDSYAHTEPVVQESTLTLPAGSSVVLTVTAVLRPERWECSCGVWGMRARHLVTTQPDTRRFLNFAHVQELPTNAEAGLELHVRGPSREALTITAGASSSRSRRAVAESSIPSADARTVQFELHRDYAASRLVPRALAGGPFLGVGGGFGKDRGLRLRGGYEMAAPQFLAIAAALEADPKHYVVLIPSVELVPPWGAVLSLFPMPGLGFGAPVQVWPQPRVGFRSQLSVGWYFFTLVGSFDLYPAMGGDARVIRGGLVAQFSM